MKPQPITKIDERWKLCGRCNHMFHLDVDICPVCKMSKGIAIKYRKGRFIQLQETCQDPLPYITPKALALVQSGIIKRKVTLFRLPIIVFRFILKVAKAIVESQSFIKYKTIFISFKNGARTLTDLKIIETHDRTIQKAINGKSKRTKHPKVKR